MLLNLISGLLTRVGVKAKGSPGRAGSSRALQVKHASQRSTAARAAGEHASFDPTEADILSSRSSAARDGLRYPALDLEDQSKLLASQPEEPRLRVGAKDEDTEASCLCGPVSEAPPPPPNKFNPVPIIATVASVPVIANWYTTNPATNPPDANKDDQSFTIGADVPVEAIGVTLTETDGKPLPSSDDGGPVQVTIEVPDTAKLSEEGTTAGDAKVAASAGGDPSVSQGAAEVAVTPTVDDQIDTKQETEAVAEEPASQTSELKDTLAELEQPVVLPDVWASAEAYAQPVTHTLAHANATVYAVPVSNTMMANPSPDMVVSQQGAVNMIQVQANPGNEVQKVVTGTDARYPALKMDASSDAQYIAPPALPNYMPKPGVQRSANCDANNPGTFDDSFLLQGNSQMNVASSAGDYSAYYSTPDQTAQTRPIPQAPPRDMSQHQVVPDMVAPPASPLPLATPYSGQGSYSVPRQPSTSDADPWGLLGNQGAYGLSQGLLNIDGAGGSGTYGAFSYGPPTQNYSAPLPANTQEGYRAYGQSQGQQYAAQPPQAYAQRGGGQQSYQGAPPQGYYYPPAGGAAPAPSQARRQAPEPQYAAPPVQGSYSYQASPAGTTQDPYAGQYAGNQAYASGNQPYGSTNQPYGGGNQQFAGGNQPYAYAGGNQPHAGGNMPGNQSYAPAQYGGNQAYAAPPTRGGNYTPPVESTQSSYPGIELLSPGYQEYDRGHKGASQQKPSAPPPEAYYPGIDSTYSAYGMRAPTAPTSNTPSQPEYSSTQNSQSYGYSYYTSPSNYQGQMQPPASSGGADRGPVVGYFPAPVPVPESSYAQGYYFQGYSGQNGGSAYSVQPAPGLRSYGQWPTADKAEQRQAETLVLPMHDAPDLSLPVTTVSGPITADTQPLQQALKAQLPLGKLHEQHIPMATLPAPTSFEPVSALASVPAASLDTSLLAAAFCCMMAAKGADKNI